MERYIGILTEMVGGMRMMIKYHHEKRVSVSRI